MEGTNDLWYVSTGTVVDRVRLAIHNIVAAGKTPVIGTLLPDTRGNTNNIKRIPLTNDGIRRVVASENVLLADLYTAASFSGWARLMADGLHPNYSGYQLMASTWYTALEDILPPPDDPVIGFVPAVWLLLSD